MRSLERLSIRRLGDFIGRREMNRRWLAVDVSICYLPAAAAAHPPVRRPRQRRASSSSRAISPFGDPRTLGAGAPPVLSASAILARVCSAMTGFTGPSGGALSLGAGRVAPSPDRNGSAGVTVGFAPTENRSYSGTMTVNANHTDRSEHDSAIDARGLRELFTAKNGFGNTVFRHADGRPRAFGFRAPRNRTQTSNFIVRIAGRVGRQ